MHFSKLFKIKEEKVEKIRDWFAQLSGLRRAEAIATFGYENITREAFVIFKGTDGNQYVTGFNEITENATEPGPSDKTVSINLEHKAIMRECLEPISESGEVLMDLNV